MIAIDYIDIIRKKHDISDYKTAQLLGISPARVSTYRCGKSKTFEDDISIKVAELLETDPAQIIAEMHKEKAKTRKEKNVWESIAKALRATTAVYLATAIISLGNTNTSDLTVTYKEAIHKYYILC